MISRLFLDYVSHRGHAPKRSATDPSVVSKWGNLYNPSFQILIYLTVYTL